ncbi:DUF4922 domain-containing protein [Aliikangiella sp. G2MR2-5]|uniref:DUF4922 domain-containing protein n=1 Tax=Aliikangiella sp. G2MR2-5 TaxID=2788943 RepID=UPI0018A9FE83|nr:DUF4922 domain-containing protein [Aliikangiella sp. G2MR2-5]
MIWSKAEKIAISAKNCGSLFPITTNAKQLSQDSIDFELRVINQNIHTKISTSKTQGNPFLPYDDDMYVCDIGDEHVCLLNKFPVLTPHILVCSKTFVEQREALTLQDFAAWIECFQNGDELGFYNGGRDAGASQPHRHMQLVLGKAPLETTILKGQLPFEHKLYRFDELNAEDVYSCYLAGMKELALLAKPYCKANNLLLTNRWFLIVPRSKVKHEDIFLNGLNYAGYFLLKSEEQHTYLKENSCLSVLTECSFAVSGR